MRARNLITAAFALTLISLAPAAMASPGAAFLPPTRVDVSPSSSLTSDGAHAGLHVLAGLHWASVSPNWKTDFDIGIGYVYDQFAPISADQRSIARSGQPSAVVEAEAERWVGVHGTYLELARRPFGTRHKRHWLAVRAEMLFGAVDGRTRMGVGVTGRAAWELFATVKASNRNSGIIGAVAIGTYIEVGARHLPDGRAALLSTVGLSVRIPLIAASN